MQSTSTILSFLTSIPVATHASRVLGVVSGISFGTFVVLQIDAIAGFTNPRLSAQRNGALQLGIVSSLGAAYWIAPVAFRQLIKETWGVGRLVLVITGGSFLMLVASAALRYASSNSRVPIHPPFFVHRIMNALMLVKNGSTIGQGQTQNQQFRSATAATVLFPPTVGDQDGR